MKRTISIVLVLLLAIGMLAGCSGNKEYPSKDIQFFVNADAGGGTDAICRKVTQLVEGNTEAKFYLVNKPGVTDSVGPSLCMDAEPDGYTLCNLIYGSVVTSVYQQVVENYDLDRLVPIAFVTEEADSFVTAHDAPYQTFDELIEYAKANPGDVKVGDHGIGTRTNLLVRKIEREFGVEFNKIGYSSSAPQREALLSDEVDVIVSSLGDFNSILTNGDAIGLVEFSSARNNAYPDVPICGELGMDESFQSGSFLYVAAPAGTPDEIVTYLRDEFQKAVESEDFKEWTTSVGVTPRFMATDEIKDYIKALQEKDFAALDELKAEGLL